jgi:uncharacterized membrane protein HdeD (DUF308 family)
MSTNPMPVSPMSLFTPHPRHSLAWSILLIVLGLLALALPLATGVGVAIVVAVLIIVAGIAHFAAAFAARHLGGLLWQLLIGAVYVIGGVYLFIRPGLDLLGLTLALAIVFFFEGVFRIVSWFTFRHVPGSGWALFDGVVTLILAFLIWRSWPASAVWAIGTIFGVNLLISGFSGLMYASRTRRVNPV